MKRVIRWIIDEMGVLLLFCGGYLFAMLINWANDREPPRDPALDRACFLAAGNARAHAQWLTPGHARWEAGLLLLSGDATWAPLCARDRGAGAKLRSQIDAVMGQPDAPGAESLAAQLVLILEDR